MTKRCIKQALACCALPPPPYHFFYILSSVCFSVTKIDLQICYWSIYFLGKDWIWGNQDEGAGNIGSVLVFQSSGAVLVRIMIQIMLKNMKKDLQIWPNINYIWYSTFTCTKVSLNFLDKNIYLFYQPEQPLSRIVKQCFLLFITFSCFLTIIKIYDTIKCENIFLSALSLSIYTSNSWWHVLGSCIDFKMIWVNSHQIGGFCIFF